MSIVDANSPAQFIEFCDEDLCAAKQYLKACCSSKEDALGYANVLLDVQRNIALMQIDGSESNDQVGKQISLFAFQVGCVLLRSWLAERVSEIDGNDNLSQPEMTPDHTSAVIA